MSDQIPCPWCKNGMAQTGSARAEHLLACAEAPEPAKDEARKHLEVRRVVRESVTCCRLRKKFRVNVQACSEDFCGVPDTELADVLTFDKSPQGRDVVAFRFCPWCGKPWAPTGQIHEPDHG